jgi:predicted short-subunit dehydrogenase-like oxidoreductase (DUF2520 family)
MRELERHSHPSTAHAAGRSQRVVIIGRGRVGTGLGAALSAAGVQVDGPLGRGADGRCADGRCADAVLLCVPDSEIAAAAACVQVGPPVGHCSGAGGLELLAPHAAFSLHPLMTFTADGPPPRLARAAAAIDGSSPESLAAARALAETLEMTPIEVAPEDRGAYHAAASIASNFLVTLEGAAERLAITAGVHREQLLPLVRATVDNWARLGPERALTGPVVRGDEATVQRQRAAIAERTPDLIELFDQLVEATRGVAAGSGTPVAR